MNTYLYKGLTITTRTIPLGLRFVSILLPNGLLITGHSRSIAFLRKYTTDSNNSNEGQNPVLDLNTFPVAIEFKNLHQPEIFNEVCGALKGKSGIYSFECIITGARYTGSSNDLYERFNHHVIGYKSNERLQNSISKYGLENFVFKIVEFCDSSDRLSREQVYLDILFTLPKELRYNFSPVAEAPFAGRNHSEGSKAKISESLKGHEVSAETKAKISSAVKGENHPMFGKTHTAEARVKVSSAKNKPVSIFTLENELVQSFPSISKAAQFLGMSNWGVSLAIKRESIVQGRYRVQYSTSLNDEE
jgi:group I intron endonuclease